MHGINTGKKILREFRGQVLAEQEDNLDDWDCVDAYCPECEITMSAPVDMERLDRIARRKGLAKLIYLVPCIQCEKELKCEIIDDSWSDYAKKGPMNRWQKGVQVGAGVLLAVGFGIFVKRRRDR